MTDDGVFRDVGGGRSLLSEKASPFVDGRGESPHVLW